MPKTRRHKINQRPKSVFGSRSVAPRVLAAGTRTVSNGVRADENGQQQRNDKAKPAFIGRTYTGVNTGKVYPYRSAKRGG